MSDHPLDLGQYEITDAMTFRLMTLGGALTLKMVEKHLTPKKFAAQLGIPESSLRNMMSGSATNVDVISLMRIADALGTTLVIGFGQLQQPQPSTQPPPGFGQQQNIQPPPAVAQARAHPNG